MSLKDWITATLRERLDPIRLVVEDESQQHSAMPAGARAARPISALMWCRGPSKGRAGSSATASSTRRSAGAFERGLHALAIQAKAPGEG